MIESSQGSYGLSETEPVHIDPRQCSPPAWETCLRKSSSRCTTPEVPRARGARPGANAEMYCPDSVFRSMHSTHPKHPPPTARLHEPKGRVPTTRASRLCMWSSHRKSPWLTVRIESSRSDFEPPHARPTRGPPPAHRWRWTSPKMPLALPTKAKPTIESSTAPTRRHAPPKAQRACQTGA